MKKRILSLILAMGLCLNLAACGSKPSEPTAPSQDSGAGTGSGSAEKITVRIATQHPDDYPSSVAMLKLAEDLEEKSGGALVCDVYTNNALGGELDILDQARTGSVDIIYCSPTAATMNPKINVFDLPFLFDSYEQVEKVVTNQELMNEILGDFIDFGLRPMSAYENGLRVVSSNKKVESLADLKGLKMRVPQAPISVAIFNALGCNATRVALAHNHVSGVALWSDADVDTTLYLKPLLQAAGIELVDHFIIANDDMVSMADSGLLKD